ncbi:hypothetical protein L218DRAFT_11240 [Marasmius fiardii PR-910]|nr:hypothetical protein L218DRAFT_11240 [Marasmius fiardii PR-910]
MSRKKIQPPPLKPPPPPSTPPLPNPPPPSPNSLHSLLRAPPAEPIKRPLAIPPMTGAAIPPPPQCSVPIGMTSQKSGGASRIHIILRRIVDCTSSTTLLLGGKDQRNAKIKERNIPSLMLLVPPWYRSLIFQDTSFSFYNDTHRMDRFRWIGTGTDLVENEMIYIIWVAESIYKEEGRMRLHHGVGAEKSPGSITKYNGKPT